MLAKPCVLKRFGNALVPAAGAVIVKPRLTMSVLAPARGQEYGIVTVHAAVVPLRVAATPADSNIVRPLVSNTEADPVHDITSLAGMLDFTEIVKL